MPPPDSWPGSMPKLPLHPAASSLATHTGPKRRGMGLRGDHAFARPQKESPRHPLLRARVYRCCLQVCIDLRSQAATTLATPAMGIARSLARRRIPQRAETGSPSTRHMPLIARSRGRRRRPALEIDTACKCSARAKRADGCAQGVAKLSPRRGRWPLPAAHLYNAVRCVSTSTDGSTKSASSKRSASTQGGGIALPRARMVRGKGNDEEVIPRRPPGTQRRIGTQGRNMMSRDKLQARAARLHSLLIAVCRRMLGRCHSQNLPRAAFLGVAESPITGARVGRHGACHKRATHSAQAGPPVFLPRVALLIRASESFSRAVRASARFSDLVAPHRSPHSSRSLLPLSRRVLPKCPQLVL